MLPVRKNLTEEVTNDRHFSAPSGMAIRFDDAFKSLQRAARLAPEDGDVLYRAGVCAINQGFWSR